MTESLAPESTAHKTATAGSAGSADSVSPRPAVVLGVVALDTNEPRQLADFYAALLGWEVDRADEDWVEIHPPTELKGRSTGSEAGSTGWNPGLAFQLVLDYQAPSWPGQMVPQQFHVDFDVADLDDGERFALSLGAQRVTGAGVEGHFRVFLDPSGHPFCLCQGD